MNKIVINYRVAAEYCNFPCVYCNPNGWRFTKKDRLKHLYKNQDVVNKNIGMLFNAIKTKYEVPIFLNIQGGEPALVDLKYYKNLVKYIDFDLINDIKIQTNLSGSVEYYTELNKIFNNRLVIDAAYHAPFGTLDDFINKVLEIQKNVFGIFIHFTVDDNNFIGEEKYNEIVNKGIKIQLVRIYNKSVYKNTKLTNPFLVKYFEEHPSEGKIIKSTNLPNGLKLKNNKINIVYGTRKIPGAFINKKMNGFFTFFSNNEGNRLYNHLNWNDDIINKFLDVNIQ